MTPNHAVDRLRRERDRREHVASDQPLWRLFTVPLDEVRRRVTTGGKHPQPPGER